MPHRISETDTTLLNPDDYDNDPQKLGNYVYGNRLGNNGSGDGFRYRGRGIFQLTGKSNHQAFNSYYRANYDNTKDLISNPELIASDLEIGVISALWYFENRVMNQITISSNTTVKAITNKINGGTNGLKDRANKFEKAEENIDCK